MGNESTFKYKFLKTSWGILIDLTAKFVPCEPSPLEADDNETLHITNQLWLHLQLGNLRLTEDEKQMLVLGARMILNASSSSLPGISGMIEITGIDYPLTEYQPEGLACALAGWAAKEWDIPMLEIPIRYDKPKNVYFFKFPGLPEMGTHAISGRIIME
jgi:hypothetical protein